jgi:hypothetical protein
MDSMLPQPKTLEEISLMFSLNKLFASRRNLVGKSFSIDSYVDQLRNGKTIETSSLAFDRMNVYFLNRSMHQANEACNKLWATIELLYSAKSDKRLCRKFREEFVPSSAVPTLHYANMAAILAILSLFGVSSTVQRGKKLIFYNIVRTARGIVMVERNKYLGSLFGFAKIGWHAQVLQTYEGLLKKGVKLPNVDIASSNRLLRERSKFHYDILGQTSMRDVYGVNRCFQFLPTTVASTEFAIDSIHQVQNPIPNACDSRFEELEKKIPVLKNVYEVTP